MNQQNIPRSIPFVACVLVGLLIGWWLWHPHDAVVEGHAAAIDLPSGGHVIERVPDAPIPEAVPQAVKELGHGAKLERVISLTVKTKPLNDPFTDSVNGTAFGSVVQPRAPECAPVHIDLGLVRMPDSTHRVIATSDGQILQSVDIPVDSPAVQRQLKWAIGAAYDAVNKRYGGFIDRDLGPFRFGVEILQPAASERAFTAVAKIGIRF
jgi:hypothetical protein